MKDKLQVRVLLTPTHKEYSFFLPLDLSVAECASLISRLFERMEHGYWQCTGEEDLMLCDPDLPSTGELLNPNESIRALKAQEIVADGSLLALM